MGITSRLKAIIDGMPPDGAVTLTVAFLSRLIEAEQPEVVAYEDVQFNRGRSYIPGMTALLTVVAHEFGLSCFGVPAPTLKAFARRSAPAGERTGSKADMRRALVERGRPTAKTSDEVDAAWVALWARETLSEVVA